MEKWEERLTEFVSELSKKKECDLQTGSLDKWEPEIKDFFKSTVNPVFEEIAFGITKLGRQVTRRKARFVGGLVDFAEQMTIEFKGEYEFCYEIGIEPFTGTPRAKVRSTASMEQREWHTAANDFRDITKDGLAEEFMAMYNYKMKNP